MFWRLILLGNSFCIGGYRYKFKDSFKLERVIVKSGVSASELGGDLVNGFHLDSIFKFYSSNDLRQVVEPA